VLYTVQRALNLGVYIRSVEELESASRKQGGQCEKDHSREEGIGILEKCEPDIITADPMTEHYNAGLVMSENNKGNAPPRGHTHTSSYRSFKGGGLHLLF
jgi:hypothetical protein